MSTPRTVVLLVALLTPAAVFAQKPPTYLSVETAPPVRSLVVVGTARLEVIPDEACVELTFTALDGEMPKAHEALQGHVAAFTKAVGSRAGVRLEKGATRYDAEYAQDGNRRRLSGYRATQQINLRTKDFDRIPEVVGLAAAHGLDTVRVVTYDTAMVERKTELREAAMRAAREKAEALAAGFGVRVGAVRTVREGAAESGGGFGANVNHYVVRPDVDEVAAPMAPGSIPLTLSVHVEFDLEG